MTIVMDKAVMEAFPLVAASPSGQQQPAPNFGIRYLVGRHGVFREITFPWILVRQLVAPSALELPYGVVENVVEFRCGPLPGSVLREFVAEAKQAQPLEVAGVFLWNKVDDSWRYVRREAKSASGEHIAFHEVRPREDEELVIDVHSHGLHAAFFTDKDDADDMGAIKVSLVLGNLDQDRPTSKMRLCAAGLVQPAFLNGDGRMGVLQ